MFLSDSPVVQRDLAGLAPEQRREYLDALRYEGCYDELATNMRILLRVLGKTQREVAASMATSETALSRLLHGKAVRKAKLETLTKFARALDVDVRDLWRDPKEVAQSREDAQRPPPPAVTVWTTPQASVARPSATKVLWAGHSTGFGANQTAYA